MAQSKPQTDKQLRQEQRTFGWLVWLQGILLAGLIILTLLSIGAYFVEGVAGGWNRAGLLVTFALVYAMHFPNTLVQRELLRHILWLNELAPERLQDEPKARLLNQQLERVRKLSVWWMVLIAPLVIAALVKVLMAEEGTWWFYLSPVYAAALLLILGVQYRRYRRVKENNAAFEQLLPASR